MAAEYIMSEGNPNVIVCERGIRTFETRTRNSFDLNAIPVLHGLTHLPVCADPSHATGHTRYVTPMALAATAAGADCLEIEVHDDPKHAWSDHARRHARAVPRRHGAHRQGARGCDHGGRVAWTR